MRTMKMEKLKKKKKRKLLARVPKSSLSIRSIPQFRLTFNSFKVDKETKRQRDKGTERQRDRQKTER
jgi:hypothetical protein